MPTKALDLFQAYSKNELPREGGYIVSSFFSEISTYSRYEVIAYNAVKSLYLSTDGLTFHSDGCKLYILVEPATYPKKYIEPFRRDDGEKIPHRFDELEILISSDQSKIMVSKTPIMTYSSFTILRPSGINFAFIFFKLPDILQSVGLFFEKTLNAEAKIPKSNSKKAATLIMDGIKKFSIF